MRFLKFIKNYKKFKKVIEELEYRKGIIDISLTKVRKTLNSHSNSMDSYYKKKIKFYEGKHEGYNNSLIIIEKFIDTGELPDVQDTEY